MNIDRIRQSWWFGAACAAVGALVMLLLTTVSNIYSNNLNFKNANKQAALDSFQEVAYKLEPLGQMYIDAELKKDENLTAETKKVLLTNIAEQVSAAKKVSPYLNDPKLAETYMSSVLELRKQINSDLSIEDKSPFWDATIEVAESRDQIFNQNRLK